MNVYDIEIHKITEQYLAYIKMMKELNLEVAGDFVAMAANLIHIKSKMLLPQYDEEGLPVEEDPRQELVSRLLEYERFQQAGKSLYDRQLLGREVFARGFKLETTAADPTIILDEGGLFALIGLYRKAIKKIKKNVHVVMEKTQSLSSRILEIRDRLIPGYRVRFDQLIHENERTKPKWIITFMSMLELGRLGFVSIFQNEAYGPIHIDTKKTIERDVVSQVQELEAQELQALDVNATHMIATGPAEPEPEAASDAEIDEAERQMELAEAVVQSENLGELLEAAPTEGMMAQAATIETINALESAMQSAPEHTVIETEQRFSEEEGAVSESEAAIALQIATETETKTKTKTETELLAADLSGGDIPGPGEPEPSPSV